MITVQTSRPRDVNKWRAAAILYGDWGTSKAYVIGLAFALAGYSSFWFILAVSLLTLMVGINYITICKMYPFGGGVYASVRKRSEALSLIGAFFLISDYLVTASLSSLSAFNYLGFNQPELWAILAIAIVGGLNYFGPKHTGSLAVGIAIPTALVILLLALVGLPFLPQAISNLQPISHDFFKDWNVFVGVIVGLSGIEAIANTTGSMKLDRGSSHQNPSVIRTSTPAIITVMLEVSIFTALFGLAMNALPSLEINGQDVSAPGYPNVRDAMLRYMAEVFGSQILGVQVGIYFSYLVMFMVALLLLSAVNTAIVALISLFFVLSRDGELPLAFQKLNPFGVPVYGVLLSTLCPIILLLVVNDVAGLANLYAIGFVGAIAVNLGSTSTNYQLDISPFRRYFMMLTFIIMAAIEVTLFIDKPEARNFVFSIVALGLLLRMLVKKRTQSKEQPRQAAEAYAVLPPLPEHISGGILVAVTGVNKALEFALFEAERHHLPLHVLFVREQRIMTEEQKGHSWIHDKKACEVFDYVVDSKHQKPIEFLYTITADPAHSISEIATKKSVTQVLVGRPRGSYLLNVIRGSIVRNLSKSLPQTIDLLVLY